MWKGEIFLRSSEFRIKFQTLFQTTQVPQYILDSSSAFGIKSCRILVSQPRKIAAITLAHRIAAERGTQIGVEVGFQVGLSRSQLEMPKILFCTTGVVLNKLTTFKTLSKFTHIIIDEVHERDLDTDFLLALIRRLMLTSCNTKIILMSATINQRDFVDFFRVPGHLEPAVIECSGDRMYPIEILYIDNYEHALKDSEYFIDEEMMNYDELRIPPKLIQHCCYILFAMMEKELKISPLDCRATFLIFLPGLVEIEALFNKIEFYKHNWLKHLKFSAEYGSNPIQLIVLHSALSTEVQSKVFEASLGVKIILSTNIAESAVTIPDVHMVFDFCLTRHLMKDSRTNLTSLVTDWASLQNVQQRAGRCGRTKRGIVYRLVHKRFFASRIAKTNYMPEIQRIGLEDVVLKTKVLDLGSPAEILALTMSPPKKLAINESVLHLKEVGGLKRYDADGYMNYEDGDITFLGRIMESLPIDCNLSRLILLGNILGVYDETLIIAAGLSLKSIFCFSFGSRVKAYGKKLAWADKSECDCIAILNAYTKWERIKSQQAVRFDAQWCRNNNLERRSLYEMEKLVIELRSRMSELGFKNLEKNLATLSAMEREMMIKIAIAGAFGAPNFFVARGRVDDDGDDAFRSVNYEDVFRSIYFTNMRTDVLGKVYEDQIRESLLESQVVSTKENIKVKFVDEKIVVTFEENELDFSKRKGCSSEDVDEKNKDVGDIPIEVYKGEFAWILIAKNLISNQFISAVKLRQQNVNFKIYFTDKATEQELAVQFNLGSGSRRDFQLHREFIIMPDRVFLPTKTAVRMKGFICNVGDTGRIFFKPTIVYHIDETQDDRYSKQTAELNEILAELQLAKTTQPLKEKSQIIYEHENGVRIRGQIIGTNPYVMHCLDTGANIIPDFHKIRVIVDEQKHAKVFDFPPQCFEIHLHETRPNYISSKNHRWSKTAIEHLRGLIGTKQKSTILIFSMVNEIVSVELFHQKKCVNDTLKELRLAVEVEESILSKFDHSNRIQFDPDKAAIMPQDEFNVKILDRFVSHSPGKDICHRTHLLKGPYSPLERKLYGISAQNEYLPTIVLDSSVNNILLNDDIFQAHKKFYVAANVSLSMKGNVKLDEVSALPQIPGFAVILAMIFSPVVQLRRNEKKTKYVSILCGLGFDDRTRAPILAERDVSMDLDFDMNSQHLAQINAIREMFSKLLYTKRDEVEPNLNDGEKVTSF